MSPSYGDNHGPSRTRHTSSCDPTRPFMEAPSFRIQRWIGDQDPYYPSAMSTQKSPHDSDEAHARRRHDHHAEVDWEREEFEREMALRFVMRDLQLGLEDRRGRLGSCSRDAQRHRHAPPAPATATATAAVPAPRSEPEHRRHTRTPWPCAQPSPSTTTPERPPHSLPPPPFAFPSPGPRLTRVVSSPTPTSPPLDTSTPPTPTEPFVRLLRSSTRHRASPSLSSHFSCTSSASTSADTEPEVYNAPSVSARSVVSQFGQKLRQGIIPPLPQPPTLPGHARPPPAPAPKRVPTSVPVPPLPASSVPAPPVPVPPVPATRHSSRANSTPAPAVPVPPYFPPYRPKVSGPPVVIEIPPPGGTIKKRRVSVPVSLGPKKRRLVVRGIRMDDEFGVDGVRRWASGLGEVSRMCRTQDGTIWIEFRDKRVAESVCCLQAQVQIPRVGRVVLDWAEGRQPG